MKKSKGLSPIGSISPDDMIPYETNFSIEDFEDAVRILKAQGVNKHSPVIIGSQEQIDAFYEEDFWPAMERAAIAYINYLEQRHEQY
jgi:hypothetical protein